MKINELLNSLKQLAGITQDKELAEILGIYPTAISNMRSKSLVMGASCIIKIHEAFGIPVAEIKNLAGVKRHVEPLAQVTAC